MLIGFERMKKESFYGPALAIICECFVGLWNGLQARVGPMNEDLVGFLTKKILTGPGWNSVKKNGLN